MDAIKDNARLSYSDIGAMVGLSRVAVKNRMDAMEKKGIIRGYQTVINEKLKSTELEALELSVRSSNCLHRAGYHKQRYYAPRLSLSL